MKLHAAPGVTAALVWHTYCSETALAECKDCGCGVIYVHKKVVVKNTHAKPVSQVSIDVEWSVLHKTDPQSAHVMACKQAIEGKTHVSASMFRM